MGLFTPAWKGSDKNKALAQVEKKFYQKKQMKTLFRIAQKAPLAAVRRKATAAIRYQVTRCRDSESFINGMYARLGEGFLRSLAERDDEAVNLQAIAALAQYPQHRDHAFNALAHLKNLNSRDAVDAILALCGDGAFRTAILDKISDPKTIHHPPRKNEDLGMLRMEQSLRQRIRGTETEALILGLLDADEPNMEKLQELGDHPGRDAVEALTLVLYYHKDDPGNDLAGKIFEILQRFYWDAAFEKKLLAQMRLSRFDRDKFHRDSYEQYCDCIHYAFNDLRPKYYTHSDIEDPPVTFRFR